MAIIRSRGWRDSNPNTSRTNCRHLSSTGEPTISCSTFLMCSARRWWTLSQQAFRISIRNRLPGRLQKSSLQLARKSTKRDIATPTFRHAPVCHGPEAKGDGQFPRLAGQLERLHRQQTDQLDKRAGPRSGKPRRLSHYATDRPQLESNSKSKPSLRISIIRSEPFRDPTHETHLDSHRLWVAAAASLQLALLAIVLSVTGRARSSEVRQRVRVISRPSWHIAKIATGHRDKVSVDIFPCRALPDSSRSI